MRSAWLVLGLSVLFPAVAFPAVALPGVALPAVALPAVAAAETGPPPPPPPPTAWSAPVPPPAPPPEPPHPRRVFSLTISPIHLTFPIVELTGEIRVLDQLGIAVIGGAGRISETSNGVRVSAAAYEAGGQLRYYALGDFRKGLEVGAEVLYLHLADSNLSATGEGLAVGPFVGYKVTVDAGFTFDAQLGFEYVGVRAMTTGSSASESRFIPLLNVNIGWSF